VTITHHQSKTRLYRVWRGIRTRCENANSEFYVHYGGRGIQICSEWTTFEPFAAWAYSNGYKPGLEIDRVDNDGDYKPSNCRWTTSKQNCLNRRSTRWIEAFGERKSISQWSEDARCTVSYSTLYKRIVRMNWNVEEAITRGPRGLA
jgi:hypothetical protein